MVKTDTFITADEQGKFRQRSDPILSPIHQFSQEIPMDNEMDFLLPAKCMPWPKANFPFVGVVYWIKAFRIPIVTGLSDTEINQCRVCVESVNVG